jgi:hypothetical protein
MGIASFALLSDGRPFRRWARAGVGRVIETMVAGGPHGPPASLFFTASIRVRRIDPHLTTTTNHGTA